MSAFKVLLPIIVLGDRKEAGETVELTDEEALAYGPEYLAKEGTPKIKRVSKSHSLKPYL
ncbi:MAG: hypothetical protein ABIB04_03265 [Patescibacteria group bacterium]